MVTKPERNQFPSIFKMATKGRTISNSQNNNKLWTYNITNLQMVSNYSRWLGRRPAGHTIMRHS